MRISRTAAAGLAPDEVTWLRLFAGAAARDPSIGVVVADMRVPGAPLCFISDGFERIFGHGSEKLGTNCKFTQGPETEPYLVDEIVDALRRAVPLVVKLHN